MSTTQYDDGFYAAQRYGSRASAEVVVPLLLQAFTPANVLDVGCGIGTWLSVFSEMGVEVRGVDGPYAAARGDLAIESAAFTPADLSEPLRLGLKFDLVTSFEVAEHIPSARADVFIESLVAHGQVVAFSAAIPNQGGVGHVNERWPSYWIEKFAVHGFRPWDFVRPQIWTDERVEPWYRQNLLTFIGPERDSPPPPSGIVDVVHPAVWSPDFHQVEPPTLRQLLRLLPAAVARSIRHHARISMC